MITKDIFLKGLIVFMFFDMSGFVMWSLSGQIPENNFFIGVISKTIISLII